MRLHPPQRSAALTEIPVSGEKCLVGGLAYGRAVQRTAEWNSKGFLGGFVSSGKITLPGKRRPRSQSVV